MIDTVKADPSRLENAATVAEEVVRSGEYASAVLAVANREGIFWRHVVPGDDGIAWDSIFPIASITKPIVVTALMQLVERGRVVLSDPVAQFIPEFAQNGKERVTLWHIVTHTSGLDEPSHNDWHNLVEQRVPVSTYLELAYRAPLRFEPGTQWSYGFLTFSVLSEVITRLGGQPYPDLLREHIFAPLGMVDTAFMPSDQQRLAPLRYETPETLAHLDSLAFPAGGLYSTADDLVKLGRAFLNKGELGAYRLLSEGAVATMTRVHTEGIMALEDSTPRPSFTGLGWGMRSPFGNVLGSASSYGHAGASGSWLWIDPEWNLVFALLSNTEGGKGSTPMRMLNAVYGALGR